jgi:hypothetical protein
LRADEPLPDIGFGSDIADVRASGPLFNLPTGAVHAAVGGEYRRERVSVDYDPLWTLGGWVGASVADSYDLSRDIWRPTTIAFRIATC